VAAHVRLTARDAAILAAMDPVADPAAPRGLRRVFAWRRVRTALIAVGIVFLVFAPGWNGLRFAELLPRLLITATACLLAFGILETRPRRLPRWLARWVLQIAGVAAVVPPVMWFAYVLTTQHDPQPFWFDQERLVGYGMLTSLFVIFAPWIAMASLYKQVGERARAQALAFALEKSELERQALDARMRVVAAQVEPHFLFNTLANVRELVETGSPQAGTVLGHLIDYLRAAVPRLHEPANTVARELELARAYLEVMHMRMPDRLQFAIDADPAALAQPCLPMSLITLVENAVRHGIDPAERGGRIDIFARCRDDRVVLQVVDTGVGLRPGTGSLGTGLDSLRERLAMAYGAFATLTVVPRMPSGVVAEMTFARQTGAASPPETKSVHHGSHG
jgi:signal transduction histidine kinase